MHLNTILSVIYPIELISRSPCFPSEFFRSVFQPFFPWRILSHPRKYCLVHGWDPSVVCYNPQQSQSLFMTSDWLIANQPWFLTSVTMFLDGFKKKKTSFFPRVSQVTGKKNHWNGWHPKFHKAFDGNNLWYNLWLSPSTGANLEHLQLLHQSRIYRLSWPVAVER